MIEKLKFGRGNAKLDGITTFSLPAGHSCPFAKDCFSKADRETGKLNKLIDANGLRSVEVVYSEAKAEEKGLEIDHDDSHAYDSNDSFALLIHGTQPKGSEAAKAVSNLKGKGSYGRGTKKGKGKAA